MQPGQSFDIAVRKVNYSEEEDMYRVTLFRKIESMDELLTDPRIAEFVGNSVVRIQKIDTYRYEIFVQK
jgi:hypothetical protein